AARLADHLGVFVVAGGLVVGGQGAQCHGDGSSRLSGAGGERFEAVGPEAREVGVAGDDDGGLQVAEAHDVVVGGGVFGDVDDLVGNSRVIQCAECCFASVACGFGINGDLRQFQPSSVMALILAVLPPILVV